MAGDYQKVNNFLDGKFIYSSKLYKKLTVLLHKKKKKKLSDVALSFGKPHV